MKKLLLILVLAFVSSNAMATEWKKMPSLPGITQTETYLGELTPGTRQFTLSMLVNKVDALQGIRSSITRLRGNCLTREIFVESMTGLSKSMGKGNIKSSANREQLKRLSLYGKLNPPLGIYEIMLDMFCIK